MTQQCSDIINMAKAIGIILMVVGHSGCPAWLHDFIYVFHMPLFFFLSGYCMKELYLDQKWLFVKKRMRRVWWTFVKWNIVFFALNPLFFRIGITDEYYPVKELPIVFGKVLLMGTWHELLGPFWFLRYLLLSSFVVLLACWMLRQHRRLCTALFLMMPVIPTILSLTGVSDSLKGQGLLCCFFYYCGFMLRGVSPAFQPARYALTVIVTIVAAIFVKTEIPQMQPTLALPYAVGALAGIYATMASCAWLYGHCKAVIGPLVTTGRETMHIMVWHLLAFKLVSLAFILMWQLPMNNLYGITIGGQWMNWWTWMPYAAVGLSVPLALKKSLLRLREYTHNCQ